MNSFTGQGVISQKPNNACKKHSIWPLSSLKTVDLDYRSSLLVVRLRFWFKSLQSLTAHDRQFQQDNLFLLAVHMHDVALYLCSIFCSRSLVQFSTASYCMFGAQNTPQTVSHNLKLGNWHHTSHIHVTYACMHVWCMMTHRQFKVLKHLIGLHGCNYYSTIKVTLLSGVH